MKRPRPEPAGTPPTAPLRTRHLRWGWASLLVFLTLGIVLEAFHGWKVRHYLDVGNASRRLVWTLAHAHGTLLALVNIAFAATLGQGDSRALRVASACLIVAGLLLPLGFFLAGFMPYGGDPGVGVLLVPLGAVALLVGVACAVREVFRR